MKVCGSMEDYLIIAMVMMIGIFSLVGMKMFKPNLSTNKVKTSKDDAISSLNKVNDETIERLTKQLQKESGRANKLQALKEKEEGLQEDPQENQVSFEEITALVKNSYPKYSVLLPLMKKQVMEMTKGMSLDQVLEYVKGITGDKGPKQSIDEQSEKYRSDWA